MVMIGSFDSNTMNNKKIILFKNNRKKEIKEIIKSIKNSKSINKNDLLIELFSFSDITKEFILKNFTNNIFKFILEEKEYSVLKDTEDIYDLDNKCIDIIFHKEKCLNKLIKSQRKESLKGINRLHWKFIYTIEQANYAKINFVTKKGIVLNNTMLTDKCITTITNVVPHKQDYNFNHLGLEFKNRTENFDKLMSDKKKLIFIYNIKYDKESLERFNIISDFIDKLSYLKLKIKNTEQTFDSIKYEEEFNQNLIDFENIFEELKQFFDNKI
jgi:hypothetical protein